MQIKLLLVLPVVLSLENRPILSFGEINLLHTFQTQYLLLELLLSSNNLCSSCLRSIFFNVVAQDLYP